MRMRTARSGSFDLRDASMARAEALRAAARCDVRRGGPPRAPVSPINPPSSAPAASLPARAPTPYSSSKSSPPPSPSRSSSSPKSSSPRPENAVPSKSPSSPSPPSSPSSSNCEAPPTPERHAHVSSLRSRALGPPPDRRGAPQPGQARARLGRELPRPSTRDPAHTTVPRTGSPLTASPGRRASLPATLPSPPCTRTLRFGIGPPRARLLVADPGRCAFAGRAFRALFFLPSSGALVPRVRVRALACPWWLVCFDRAGSRTESARTRPSSPLEPEPATPRRGGRTTPRPNCGRHPRMATRGA